MYPEAQMRLSNAGNRLWYHPPKTGQDCEVVIHCRYSGLLVRHTFPPLSRKAYIMQRDAFFLPQWLMRDPTPQAHRTTCAVSQWIVSDSTTARTCPSFKPVRIEAETRSRSAESPLVNSVSSFASIFPPYRRSGVSSLQSHY